MTPRNACLVSLEELFPPKAKPPVPQPCHQCTHVFAGARCPVCKEERPAYTAIKNMTRPA